jgi:PAS domain-containing protein
LSGQPRLPRTVALRLRRPRRRGGLPGHLVPRHAPDASIVVAIDMSGQQAALSALAATQERFGRFAEAVDEAVFVIDAARGEALFANRRFELVLGVGADDFLQNPASAWRYLTETDRARVDDLLHAALSHGHQEADVHVALPDGRLRVGLRFSRHA